MKTILILTGVVLIAVCLSVTFPSASLQTNKKSDSDQRSPLTRQAGNTNQQSNKQKTDKQLQSQPSSKEIDDAASPIYDLTSKDTSNQSFDNKRLQKNRSYNNFGFESIEANPTSEERILVAEDDISDFPVEKSDIILEGTVNNSTAFLSENRTAIYSEFQVAVKEIIKNATQESLLQVITTERFGGRVRFPNGQIARQRVDGQGAPLKNVQYLFFLRQKKTGGYLILTAYEMRDDKVYPLDGSRTNVGSRGNYSFDKHSGEDIQIFKNSLNNALRLQTSGGNQ